MHANRKLLIETLSNKLGEKNNMFTKNDYDRAFDFYQKENNGEDTHKFDSMRHL
jgi:hypothetical protein